MMGENFLATLSGLTWRIRRTKKFRTDRGGKKLDGECDHPDNPNREIRIHPQKRGLKELETYLHELRHANHWQLDEDVVAEVTRDEARVLWHLGYRRVKRPAKPKRGKHG